MKRIFMLSGINFESVKFDVSLYFIFRKNAISAYFRLEEIVISRYFMIRGN